MSRPAAIAQAIMETVIGRLALFFLAAADDMAAAREAAHQMLLAHQPETPDELALAAEIISLQFQILQALSTAATPEMSMNNILRLRGGAVSLSRESHKARRKLDQLQRARTDKQAVKAPISQSQPASVAVPDSVVVPVSSEEPAPVSAPASPQAPCPAVIAGPTQDSAATPPAPDAAKDLDPAELVQQVIQLAARAGGPKGLEALRKRQAAARITENFKRNQAKHASMIAASAPPPAAPATNPSA